MTNRSFPLWGRVALLASLGIAPIVVAPAAHAASFFTDLANALPSIYSYAGSDGATVGWGDGGANPTAIYWDATNHYTKIHPAFLGANSGSLALGISGNRIVGWGYGNGTNGNSHAIVWNGLVASDLHPHPFFKTKAKLRSLYCNPFCPSNTYFFGLYKT